MWHSSEQSSNKAHKMRSPSLSRPLTPNLLVILYRLLEEKRPLIPCNDDDDDNSGQKCCSTVAGFVSVDKLCFLITCSSWCSPTDTVKAVPCLGYLHNADNHRHSHRSGHTDWRYPKRENENHRQQTVSSQLSAGNVQTAPGTRYDKPVDKVNKIDPA